MVASLDSDGHVGRRERVEELFRAYAPVVLAYALRRGVQLADAEDVVGETFLVGSRRICEIPDDTLPWLRGVARRCLANHFRAERRQHALRGRLLEAAREAGVTCPGVNRPSEDPTLDAYRRLRPVEREVLQLIALEALNYAEAARTLGITRKAVYGRSARARAKLKALLPTPLS